MKVISDNKKEWSKRFTCKECNSVLEVEESDLKVINTAVAYAGESWEPELIFYCGVCKSPNYVTNKVPSGIQYAKFDRAQNRNK